MDTKQLEKDFSGICKIVWEDNQIKVKSMIEDWRNEKETNLDNVINILIDKAERYSLNVNYWDNDYLLVYYCDEETAKKIFSDLSDHDYVYEPKSPSSQIENGNDKWINTLDLDLSEPKEVNIGDLFRIRLNLPSYQRPYRWDKKNIEFFWDDICSSEIPYDFGIIVLLRDKDNKRYDIVDGQQRIVTLSLMLRSLSSPSIADTFINNATLQGKDSEKHIGYNLQWFRRQVAKIENKQKMIDKILNGYVDLVVMDNLDEALKFFDRMNTSGVALTDTDILKSHHLLALSNTNFKLTEKIKERWKGRGYIQDDSLEDPAEFKREIVKKWESCDSWWLNKWLATACALRMMIQGQYPYNMDEIGDIEQFRKGDNPNTEYTGLDSPIQDGEFFFWYAFNLYEKCNKKCEEYDQHAAHLRELLTKPKERAKAREFYDILVVYIHEKFADDVNKPQFDKLLDHIFSWLVYCCLYYDSLQFTSIRNDALKDGSLFKAITTSSTIEDCFDCYCENPLEILDRDGLAERAAGNGVKYLIRRELRRIYG